MCCICRVIRGKMQKYTISAHTQIKKTIAQRIVGIFDIQENTAFERRLFLLFIFPDLKRIYNKKKWNYFINYDILAILV